MEDFLELEEFLELEDGEKLEDLDSSREVNMEDFLELEERLEPPIWTEEAIGFYKRVKRIHDPVKIVVPCDVFEAESLIPPDKSIQLSSYS
ncbi:hypothetical protein HID58_066524, partial [Brassica napus]